MHQEDDQGYNHDLALNSGSDRYDRDHGTEEFHSSDSDVQPQGDIVSSSSVGGDDESAAIVRSEQEIGTQAHSSGCTMSSYARGRLFRRSRLPLIDSSTIHKLLIVLALIKIYAHLRERKSKRTS